MSNSGSGQGDIFDVRKIRRLVEIMNDHQLHEIDLRQGEQQIRIKRASESAPAPAIPAPAPPPQATAPPAATPEVAAAEDANTAYIKSPMVGTFYKSPNPDSPPFVKVGDHVAADTTVCIIEAMKVFNEIPAECSGKVVASLVENGEPVEYDQPLFKVSVES